MLLRKLFEGWFEIPVREVEEQITKQAISIIGQMNNTARREGITFVACSFALPDIQNLSNGELILFDNSFGVLIRCDLQVVTIRRLLSAITSCSTISAQRTIFRTCLSLNI